MGAEGSDQSLDSADKPCCVIYRHLFDGETISLASIVILRDLDIEKYWIRGRCGKLEEWKEVGGVGKGSVGRKTSESGWK